MKSQNSTGDVMTSNFNWDDAKPGMAFGSIEKGFFTALHGEKSEIIYYVGPDLTDPEMAVFTLGAFKFKDTGSWDKKILIRAPELDMLPAK